MDCAIATRGGRVITAIEWDDRIAAQYAYNFPEVRLLVQSVQSIDPEELPILIKRAGANDWDRCIPHTEPAPTIRAGSDRCDPFDLIKGGIVRRLTPEALWILQMYGCSLLLFVEARDE